jgi:ComF family protein
MIHELLHLLFPHVCVICRDLLTHNQRYCCDTCMCDFDPFPGPDGGGNAVKRTIAAHFGPSALPEQAWCRYSFHKNGKIQQAVHSLKYEGIYPLGVLFGRQLGEMIAESAEAERIEGIVPVPLHRLKKIERSYNQAEKIAAGIAEVLGKPVLNGVIKRKKYTESQTGLSLHQRRHNLEGAFIPGRRPSPRNVLLVDDVVTTGATVMAAAEALLKSGAETVHLAAVALADKN